MKARFSKQQEPERGGRIEEYYNDNVD